MILDKNHFFVMVGDVCITTEPVQLFTTLGSCIAVCAWHSDKKVTAMCHYLLPEPKREYSNKPDHYYGSLALPYMQQQLQRQAPLSDYRFSIYGAGTLLFLDDDKRNVGKANIRCAEAWASENGIRFCEQLIGGSSCRVVRIDVASGEITVKTYQDRVL